MKAWLNLRYTVPARRAMFETGLKRLGYEVMHGFPVGKFGPKDVYITWNRIGKSNEIAKRFEAVGQSVLVAENAAWGNGFAGEKWYSVALGRHNTASVNPYGGDDRWDKLGIYLPDFRRSGETVILPQRGIGSKPTAMPFGWAEKAKSKYRGRIRKHPGKVERVPLEQDLSACGRVVTWGSGAAVKAVLMGIPVVSEMPNWIGEHKATRESRLSMFRSLAWAQWRHSEIESGFAFDCLL